MEPHLLCTSCCVLAIMKWIHQMNGRIERRGIPCSLLALAITGKRTVSEMRSNVCEDPPLFMHGRPTVVRVVVIDWNSTLETVVEGRRKSDEPFEKQMFD